VTNSSWIERLAEHLGVLPSYIDQDGRTRVTSDGTRGAILAAMGFPVSSEQVAEERLNALLDESRKRLLEPVVVHERGAVHPRIRTHAPRRGGALRWRIEIRSERGRVATREGLHDSAGPLEIETPDLGIGYYDVGLTLTGSQGELTANQTLIVVPPRCIAPSDLLGDRAAFGVFANLYTLRGNENWGIGDTGDLSALVNWVGGIGGSFVGLNPLHALLNRGRDISPYGPTSRVWRNPIYIDVERVPEFRESPALAARIRSPEIAAALGALRESDHVQYEQVWATKSLALDALHEAFLQRSEREATSTRIAAYNKFVASAGPALDGYATWMAIAESRHEWSSQLWPAELQDSASAQVNQFAGERAKRVDFHKWLQFELDQQLGEIAAEARATGMEIGLYQDLAVGSSGTGADAWTHRRLFLDGISIGAPPDAYSDFGQNWGLPPLNPWALREDRYRYFMQLLRGGFRHAGALRIDHVMGLFRLFWIPHGATGREGAYVRYPSNDLLGILALESHRHRAIVVGEDLGIVPENVRPAMEKWGILSSKVLYFEREAGGKFRRQSSYPKSSLGSANTHDMPTIAGFWTGRDVELRAALGLVDDARAVDAAAEREVEKQALIDRLREDGALPLRESVATDASGVPAIKRAVHEFLCASPASLVGLSLDDLGGETEPVNVPGVGTDRFPCWSRKMRRSIHEIAATSGEDLAGCTSRARRP
jgi:4-alpha-glucanotransferase